MYPRCCQHSLEAGLTLLNQCLFFIESKISLNSGMKLNALWIGQWNYIFWSCIFFLIKSSFFPWMQKKEREKEWVSKREREILHLLVHSPINRNSQFWPKPKPGFPHWSQEPKDLNLHCCLTGHTLSGSRIERDPGKTRTRHFDFGCSIPNDSLKTVPWHL